MVCHFGENLDGNPRICVVLQILWPLEMRSTSASRLKIPPDDRSLLTTSRTTSIINMSTTSFCFQQIQSVCRERKPSQQVQEKLGQL